MTMNSPDSLAELYHAASPDYDAVATAELMREVGLKCIGFNGVCDAPSSVYTPLLSPSLLLLLPLKIPQLTHTQKTGPPNHKHAQRLPRLPTLKHHLLPLHNTHPHPLT
jgi:hypothetical protein